MSGGYSPVCRYHSSFNQCTHRATPICPPSISGLGFTPLRSPLPRLSRARNLKNPRDFRATNQEAQAVVSEESPAPSSSSFKLTYLEGNSWLWNVGGANVLVDPILVGNLDFGIPWLYDAAKRFLKKFQLEDLPELDCLLITQSLDDHCHLKTLKPLSQLQGDVPVVATPNAEAILDPLFKNVTYLNPGERCEIRTKKGIKLCIQATAGPVLGPPWQRPENGYIVTNGEGSPALYYEPHCVFNESLLKKETVEIVITPVVKQVLPSFILVSGQEDAVKLAKVLRAKFVVVMSNGDLDSKGILSEVVKQEGTLESFKELLSREVPGTRVLVPTAGVALEVPIASGMS